MPNVNYKSFETDHHFSLDRVVGWKAYYEDGSVYSSLIHTPDQLPLQDIQVVRIWYERHDDKRYADNRKMLFCLNLTGYDQYPIPGSQVRVQGNWTTMQNHDAISKAAFEDSW